MRKFLALLLFSLFVQNTFAVNVLLKSELADPDGAIISFAGKDILFFAGTRTDSVTSKETLTIYYVDMASVKERVNNTSSAALSISAFSYDPRAASGNQHRYCEVSAPDIIQLADGRIILTFTAIFKADTSELCSQVVTQNILPTIFKIEYGENGFGSPYFADDNNSGHVSGISISPVRTVSPSPLTSLTNQYARIDSSIFQDANANADIWFSYAWFDGEGNRVSTVQVNKNDATIIDNTIPNTTYDEHITEAPEIFKRGSYYYLMYSENWYNSKYQAYYKKATTVEGLVSSTVSCRLTFNSWKTRPNNSSLGYNAGHGGVIKYGDNFYFIYHYGYGNFIRDTYIEKLTFAADGNIMQITPPQIVLDEANSRGLNLTMADLLGQDNSACD